MVNCNVMQDARSFDIFLGGSQAFLGLFSENVGQDGEW